jgi:hypothetical protein
MILYLDLDGVMLQSVDGSVWNSTWRVAPYAAQFLKWALAYHSPMWLTSRDMDGSGEGIVTAFANAIGSTRPLMELAARVPSCQWSGAKTNAIELTSNYLWLDDSPRPEDLIALEREGCVSRWLEVNTDVRPDDLLRAMCRVGTLAAVNKPEVISHDQPMWLLDLLRGAQSMNWCFKIGCTTCGAGMFRSALTTHLCWRVGVKSQEADQRRGFNMVAAMSPPYRRAVVETAASDIANADIKAVIDTGRGWYDGMRMILSEIGISPENSNSLPFDVDLAVIEALRISPVWSAVKAGVDNYAARRQQQTDRHQKRQADDQLAARLRREAAAAASKLRTSEQLARSEKIATGLAEFRAMSPFERLMALADDRLRIPLGAFSLDDIPTTTEIIRALPEDVRSALAARIGMRGHHFKKLKRLLETPRLSDNAK